MEFSSPRADASALRASARDPAEVPPLFRRMLSMIYEAVLLFGIVFIADYLFDTLTQSRSGLSNRHARQAWLFAALGFYFTWFWTHSGQTLAMKTWRIRVVDRAGRPLRLGRAIVRYLACWVFILPSLSVLEALAAPSWMMALGLACSLALPPFWMLVDREHQFVHDRLAGTRLVTKV